jgi:hypothetical protein
MAVADARVEATVSETVIATEDDARQRGFTGSPPFCLADLTHSRTAVLPARSRAGIPDTRKALEQVTAA